MAFYTNYIRLCAEKGISPSAAALEIGIRKSNVTYWKSGRNKPSDITLSKIADYFGVSVAELTAEEDIKKDPTPKSEVDIELEKLMNSADQQEKRLILDLAKTIISRRNGK